MPDFVPTGVPNKLWRDVLARWVRVVLAVCIFFAALALASWRFRDQFERLGNGFVGRFGATGMALGSFLADGLHFPVPPQFYLLAAIAGDFDRALAFASVLAGSVLGGLAAFHLGRRASGIRQLSERVAAPRRLVERLVSRYGQRGLAIAGLMPVSYWLLCSMAGILHLPYRSYGILALMRIPRLVVSYALMLIAWEASRA